MEVIMSLKSHHETHQTELKNLDYTLWRLQREHDLRHQHAVNRMLNGRPRERAEQYH